MEFRIEELEQATYLAQILVENNYSVTIEKGDDEFYYVYVEDEECECCCSSEGEADVEELANAIAEALVGLAESKKPAKKFLCD